MKKRTCLILLACCLLLTACTPADDLASVPEPTPESSASASEGLSIPSAERPKAELSDRARDWSADLNYLKRNYKMYHENPFYLCSEEEFNWKLDQLAAKVDDLTDNDIYFELAAVMAGMGDIHTSVLEPDCIYDEVFPVLICCFGDQVYLSGYLKGYEQFEPYLLREIVAVNGVDITYLKQKAGSFISPINSWFSKERFGTLQCFVPAFFDWAGCGYKEGYTLQILNENREVESVEVPVISLEEYTKTDAVYPDKWLSIPFLYAYSYDWTEYYKTESGEYVYLNLGKMDNLSDVYYRELFEKTAELVRTHPGCDKLVVDLRSNPGGYLKVHDYVREGIQILKEVPVKQVFVVSGGYTTSAAMECLSMFKKELGAVTVGEPTGQFTSFFDYFSNQYGIKLILPQSQISIQIANGWHEGSPIAENYYNENGSLYEWENTVLPDAFVYQDIEDIRQGKDSVIEWILAQ